MTVHSQPRGLQTLGGLDRYPIDADSRYASLRLKHGYSSNVIFSWFIFLILWSLRSSNNHQSSVSRIRASN